jgi:uncharacterized damage-inducible protein DinB
MDLLDRLLGHDRWTTARLLELGRGLTDAHLDLPFDIGHQTLRATFGHMIYNVAFWTALMAEQPVPAERQSHPSIAALIDQHDRSYASFASLARRLQDDQRLDGTFVDHFDERQSFGATILHVAWHNAQHRSEALHILARLSVPDLPNGDPQEWEHKTEVIEPV